MNIGLPGTGIGGIFYFLCILHILILELLHRTQRRKTRVTFLRRQAVMASGIFLGFVFTEFFMEFVFMHANPFAVNKQEILLSPIFFIAPIFIPFIILSLLLLSLKILKLFITK